MSTWNYRVVKSKDGEDDWYQIHSAYYNDYGFGLSVEGARAGGNSLDELRKDLERMLEALNKPIIDETKKNTDENN